MLIRTLGPSDASAFQTLRLHGLTESPSAFLSTAEEERDTTTEELAVRLSATDDKFMVGAFEGDALVAVAGIYREAKRRLAHKAWLWGVYVHPGWRGRGVARAVVTRALEHAAALPGIRKVLLGVNAINRPAVTLYESLGFVQYAYEKDYMFIDGVAHHEIFMVYELDRR